MIADDLHDPPAKPGPEPGLWLLDEWERLRVAYNVILGLQVIAMWTIIRPRGMIGLRGLEGLALDALFANLCFCAGPVVDGYLRRIGFRGRGPTFVLFALGTLLSMGLAFLAWLGFFLPGVD